METKVRIRNDVEVQLNKTRNDKRNNSNLLRDMKKLILIALIISACSKPATVTPTPAPTKSDISFMFQNNGGIIVSIDGVDKGFQTKYQYIQAMAKGDSVIINVQPMSKQSYTTIDITNGTNLLQYVTQMGSYQYIFKFQ